MPRKSAASFDVVAVDGKPDRLSPPPHLNKAERSLFSEIVRAVHPRHFVEGDLPLLCSYVQATLIARKASRNASKIALWEKAVRAQVALARSLRLTVQSRADAKTIGRPSAGTHRTGTVGENLRCALTHATTTSSTGSKPTASGPDRGKPVRLSQAEVLAANLAHAIRQQHNYQAVARYQSHIL